MLVLIAAAAAIALWQSQNSSPDAGTQGAALVGGPFELVDHTGRSVTQAAYAGDYLLVFFGYTFCPDVCPMTLGRVSVALDALGEGAAERVRPLFISVDPERDTPEVLAAYVVAFHPRIVGLTGSAEQIKAVAKAYRVYYLRVEEEGASAEDYMMDHSTIIYLMAPDGRYLRHFSNGTNPETMAASIRDELEGG